MKNKKIVSVLSIAALTTMLAGAVDASALSWKDGAPAKYYFTYSGGEHITSVYASDKNDTFKGEIKEGQTIVTKTGTIVWRDSYTNVTKFDVDVDPGYVLESITGNVGDATIETVNAKEGKYSFHFTDKGAEAWCFGDDVDFTLNTKAIEYTVKNGEEELLTGTVENTKEFAAAEAKSGYKFAGWTTADGTVVKTIKEAVVAGAADENNVISLSPKYEAIQYTVKNGEEELLTGTVESTEEFAAAKAKPGYKFAGWTTADGTVVKTIKEAVVAGAADESNVISLSPKYEAIQYTVKDTDGNIVKTERATIGSALAAGEDKEGYTFDGWYFNNTKVETITEDMVKAADENNVITVEGRYTVNEYDVTVELYYNNDNEVCDTDGNRFEGGRLEGTKVLSVAYGTELTEDYLHKNGVDASYKLIGGKAVTVKGNTTVKAVKVDKTHESNEYKFIYNSATDGIKSVTYQVAGEPERNLDVNEAIEIVQKTVGKRKVVFTVEVEEGKALKLNCNGSKNEVTKNEDGTYSFKFTLNSDWGGSANLFVFDLEAVDAE